MKRIMKLFLSEVQLYLDDDFQFCHTDQHTQFLRALDPRNPYNQINNFQNKVRNMSTNPCFKGIGLMKSLSVFHLIIMQKDIQYDMIEDLLPLCQIKTDCFKKDQQWEQFLKEKVLYSYQNFLQKCCSSREMYSKIKFIDQKVQIQNCSFQLFFYIRNLFIHLQNIMSAISTLARFFMTWKPNTIKMFADVCAMQAIIFYNAMVQIVCKIVKYHHKFIKNENMKQMLRIIIQQQFLQIDGEIKRIILNKYYKFIQRGLCVRLFRIEDQQFLVMKKMKQICQKNTFEKRQYASLKMVSKICSKEKQKVQSLYNIDSNKITNLNCQGNQIVETQQSFKGAQQCPNSNPNSCLRVQTQKQMKKLNQLGLKRQQTDVSTRDGESSYQQQKVIASNLHIYYKN